MNIRVAYNQFILECKNGMLEKRSDRTIQNYSLAFELLLKWFPLRDTVDLDEDLLREFFRRGELKRKWKNSTLVTYRKNLNQFFLWCIKNNYLDNNPLQEIPIPKILGEIPEFYDDEEIEKILYHISMHSYSDLERARNTAMFAVLLMTGVRQGELLNLKISDVDFKSKCIRVRAITAKNREPRVLMMTYRLQEILENYLEERVKNRVDSYFFWISSTYKKGLTIHGWRHITKRLTEEIGFKIKSHKCRHTFATKFYQGSRDIVSLQQILGHRKITTTMIYTQVLPENTKASLEKNPINHIF